jgi:hypothetical protein
MAKADEIARHLKAAAAMIGAHRRRARHLAVDPDTGQVERGQRAGEILVSVVSGEQQQSIHPPPAHRGYESGLAFLGVPGCAEHQDVAGALQFLFRGVDHLAVERVGDIRDHAADRVARARAQRLRGGMWLEPESVHHAHDPGVQFRTRMRLAVQHPADARDRHAGLRGDIADGRAQGWSRLGSGHRSCVPAVSS